MSCLMDCHSGAWALRHDEAGRSACPGHSFLTRLRAPTTFRERQRLLRAGTRRNALRKGKNGRTALLPVLAIVCAAGTIFSSSAEAGRFYIPLVPIITNALRYEQQQRIAYARQSWMQVNGSIQSCLRTNYSIEVNQLIRQGIAADDSRVQPYIGSCQQAIAAAEAAQQQAAERQQQLVDAARQSWAQVDSSIRDCLQSKYSTSTDDLIARGVAADDPTEQANIIGCENEIAAEKAAAIRQQQLAEARQDERRKKFASEYGDQAANAIMNHTVFVGMTEDELLDSRGNPDSKQSSPPNGEVWIYGAQRVVLSNRRVAVAGN